MPYATHEKENMGIRLKDLSKLGYRDNVALQSGSSHRWQTLQAPKQRTDYQDTERRTGKPRYL